MSSKLVEDFERNALKNENNLAIMYTNNQCNLRLTYKDVHNFVNLIKNDIEKYFKAVQCVAIVSSHHPLLPILIFGVLKSKSAVHLINPTQKHSQTLEILQRMQISCLLYYEDENNSFASCLQQLGALKCTVQLFEDLPKIQIWKTNFSESKFDFSNICYTITTSGTTGDSKIVRVTNDSIYANVKQLRSIFNIDTRDIIALNTPVTFDPIFIEILLALCSGAVLKITTEKVRSNPKLLLQTLFQSNDNVTFLQMPPSLFMRWNQVEIKDIIFGKQSHLRTLLIGGEVFDRNILTLNENENINIYNIYGITEVSCWASIWKYNNTLSVESLSKIPLGSPLDDTMFQIRGEDGNVIEFGDGELFIGSNTRICLLNDETLEMVNKPIFRSTGDLVTKMVTGELFYIGRKNEIVKHFGNKLCLPDIENSVKEATNLSCCCIYEQESQKLVLYVILQETDTVVLKKIQDKIRVKLLKVLDKKLMLNVIEILPNFPLTNHGKIDKRSLKSIFLNKSNFKSDVFTPVKLFESLCCKYLALNPQELKNAQNRNFHELGGNSLTILQLIGEFKEEYACDIFEKNLYAFLHEKTFEDCWKYCNDYEANFSKKRRHADIRKEDEKRMSITYGSSEKISTEILWKYDMEACVDASPAIFQTTQRTLIAQGSFSNKFAILDAENGSEVFSAKFPNSIENSACVSQCKARIFFGCFDNYLYCVGVEENMEIWKYETGSRIKCTPCLILDGNAVVFGSYDKYLHCVCAQEGKMLWKINLLGSITSNPIHDSNLRCVFVATLQGNYFSVNETNGDIIWKQERGYPVFGAPCFVSKGDRICWGDVQGNVRCFSTKDGKELWNFKADGNIYSSMVAHENYYIMFSCHDENVYVLNCEDEKNVTSRKILLKDKISSTPCIFKNSKSKEEIFISVTNSGNVYFVNFRTGNVMNCLKLGLEVYSSPVVLNSRFYVGCRDNYLYCIKIV